MFWGQKHPVSDEQLSAYADGRVPSEERSRLEAHVDSCATCREALAELRALRQALSSMPPATLPRSFALREGDVRRPERSGAAAGGLSVAMPMLSGVTMAAFLAFGVLLGMDMIDTSTNGSSDEASAPMPVTSSYDASERGPGAEDAALPPTLGAANDGLQRLTATAAPAAQGFVVPSATPLLPPAEEVARGEPDGDGDNTALRMAEMATAAVGLVAGGALTMAWWRRRT